MKLYSFFRGLSVALMVSGGLAGAEALAEGASPKSPAIPILSVPITISAPGTYILKHNFGLAASSGTAIKVTASDVTIDLGGNVLSSSASADNSNLSVGISLSGSGHCTVRNGTIRNFRNAIDTPVDIDHVQIDEITTDHIGRAALFLSANTIEVTRCTLRDTGYQTSAVASDIWGIYAEGGAIKITDNIVERTNHGSGQFARPIQVSSGDAMVSRNFVRNAPGSLAFFGIGILGGNASFVSENSVTYATYGITFSNSAQGKYLNNTTFGCTTPFSGGTAVGSNN